MDDTEDASTEVKLACLASLLSDKTIDCLEKLSRSRQETVESLLLDILVNVDGNIEDAANKLNQSPVTEHHQESPDLSKDLSVSSLAPKKSKNWPRPHDSFSGHTLALELPSTKLDPSQGRFNPQDAVGDQKRPIRKAVFTLGTPELVSKHTPCTLINGALPQNLARRLYDALQTESRDWERNKWFLFDRQVTSPHTTSFYSEGMSEAATEWFYNAKQNRARSFTPEMNEARILIKAIVNEQLEAKKRYSLEYQSAWEPNVAAANCYRGAKENVGWHSDQLTYLGPCPTIASLSLGVTRHFRLKSHDGQTFSIPLRHNSLLIMHAPVQELFKHSIVAVNAIDLWNDRPERFNMTFRFYRPDFAPDHPSGVVRCRCPVSAGNRATLPAVLRPDMKAINGYDRGARVTSDDKERAILRLPIEESSHLYFWMCNGGSQNEGKSCGFFKRLSETLENRGPFVGPR